MGVKKGIIWTLLALLPIGHAAAMPLDGGSRLGDKLAPEVCVPPGLPPYTAWIAQAAQVGIFQTVDNRPALGVKALYEAGGMKLSVVWINGILASVDPDPSNPAVMVWLDLGMTGPSGLILRTPKSTCDWQRATPSPPENPLAPSSEEQT